MEFFQKIAKRAVLLGLLAFSASTLVNAQSAGVGTWPTQKPIRLIAVFPPGGSVDQVARILAPALQAELKQNVIVENIGGASGVIGTAAMTRSDPDGYTFAVVFDTHGVNPSLKDTQKYLMKKIDKYTTKIHYIMYILDIISQIIEQEEPLDMDSDSSDDDSIGTIGTQEIQLVDECSDEED